MDAKTEAAAKKRVYTQRDELLSCLIRIQNKLIEYNLFKEDSPLLADIEKNIDKCISK